MVTSVVVPLDGTPFAERAVAAGRRAAGQFDVSLRLFRATWTDLPGVQDYLDTMAASITDVAVTTTAAQGFAATALAQAVADEPTALICLHTHGHAGVPALFLDSTAEELLRVAPHQALLVGPEADPGALHREEQRIVIVGHDGSDEADQLGDVAIEWAEAFGYDVHVVMVLHRDGEFLGDHPAEPYRRRAEALADKVRAQGLVAETSFPDHLEVAHALVDYATAHPTAMIVAGRKPRGVAGAVLGGVALRVVRHSPVPVLAV